MRAAVDSEPDHPARVRQCRCGSQQNTPFFWYRKQKGGGARDWRGEMHEAGRWWAGINPVCHIPDCKKSISQWHWRRRIFSLVHSEAKGSNRTRMQTGNTPYRVLAAGNQDRMELRSTGFFVKAQQLPPTLATSIWPDDSCPPADEPFKGWPLQTRGQLDARKNKLVSKSKSALDWREAYLLRLTGPSPAHCCEPH